MKKLSLLAALGLAVSLSACVTTGEGSGSGSNTVIKVDNTTSFASSTDTSAPKPKSKGMMSSLFGGTGLGSGDEKAKEANDKTIAASLLSALGGKPGEKLYWATQETHARGYVVVGAANGKDATGAACHPYVVAVTVKDGANTFNRSLCGQDDTVLGTLKDIAGDAYKAPATAEKAKPGKAKPAKAAK